MKVPIALALGAVATVLFTATAIGVVNPDVNGSGKVDAIDIGIVRSSFGQLLPTPTPAVETVGDRALFGRYSPGFQLPVIFDLLDTDTGQVVASYPRGYDVGGVHSSCDGRYSSLILMEDPNDISAGVRNAVIDTSSGALRAQSGIFEADQSAPARTAFTCPFKGTVASNRALVFRIAGAGLLELTLLDVSTGAVLLVDPEVNGNGVALSCDQSVAMYQTYKVNVGDSDIKMIRVVDGSLVASFAPPHGLFHPTC